jgi:hypothetical protein
MASTFVQQKGNKISLASLSDDDDDLPSIHTIVARSRRLAPRTLAIDLTCDSDGDDTEVS